MNKYQAQDTLAVPLPSAPAGAREEQGVSFRRVLP
jgi:hypothetical protein